MEKSKICNYINVILMGILLVLHFMPFWSYDGLSTSIQSYIWFPSDHAQLEAFLAGQIDGHTVSSIVMMPVMVLLLTVIGIVLSIWKSDVPFIALIPLVCGLVGIWGYMSMPAMQLGSNWMLHLIICILMAVSAVLTLVFHSKND